MFLAVIIVFAFLAVCAVAAFVLVSIFQAANKGFGEEIADAVKKIENER